MRFYVMTFCGGCTMIQGPFLVEEIQAFIHEDLINMSDTRVSIDGNMWEHITQVPELLPETILPSYRTIMECVV